MKRSKVVYILDFKTLFFSFTKHFYLCYKLSVFPYLKNRCLCLLSLNLYLLFDIFFFFILIFHLYPTLLVAFFLHLMIIFILFAFLSLLRLLFFILFVYYLSIFLLINILFLHFFNFFITDFVYAC